MLKQDRTRLMERHAARANAMQPPANVRVENKPVQQEVAKHKWKNAQCSK